MKPTPLRGLSRRSRALYRRIQSDYELGPHHERLLELLCQALDRCDEAQRALDEDGLVIEDRWGQKKPHPCVSIRRDAEVIVARLTRELSLDDEVVPEARPPRIQGRYVS